MVEEIMQIQRPAESRTGFPLHSFAVHFPVGLWLTSFLLDVVVLVRPEQPLLPETSTILLWAGLLTSLPAALLGWRDYTRHLRPEHPDALRTARMHLSLNAFLILWYAVVASLRSFGGPFFGAMSGLQFLMSAIGFGVLLRSAALGGRLTYLHRVGVVAIEPSREAEPRKRPDQAA